MGADRRRNEERTIKTDVIWKLRAMDSRTIEDIKVKDVEKRKSPTKHYAYIIEVEWSDGTTALIGRQYSTFFDFQIALLDQFPLEGGQQDPSCRIIPFLPGKILFRRSNTREVALKRMGPIAEYCTGIAKMPKHISESDIVLDFFEPTPEDLAMTKNTARASTEKSAAKKTANKITGPLTLDKYVAIAEYKKEDKKQLNLREGEVVEVVEKNENGWWLAANEEGINGWVPGVYLESLYEERRSPAKAAGRAEPGQGEMFTAITAYTASSSDELSFQSGDAVEVLEKNLEGWWYARSDSGEGWVPATYLEKATIPQRQKTRNQTSPIHVQEAYVTSAAEIRRNRQRSIRGSIRPPPKRSSVRRTLTKAAIAKVQTDFRAKMIRQETFSEEEDEEFASMYVTISDFNASIPDGISFEKEQTVYVTQKSNAGWWFGRIGDQRGWVPETYLKEISRGKPSASPLKNAAKASNGGRSPVPSQNERDLFPPPRGNQLSPAKNSKPPRPQRPPVIKGHGFDTGTHTSGPISPKAKFGEKSSNTRKPQPIPSLSPRKMFRKPSMSLTDYEWYKDITRQDAESALRGEGEEGYFIIRPSQRGAKQGKPYSLTLFHQGIVWNFHIRRRTNDQRYAVGVYKESEPSFPTLQELVDYYKDNFMVIGDDENMVKLVDSPNDLYTAC